MDSNVATMCDCIATLFFLMQPHMNINVATFLLQVLHILSFQLLNFCNISKTSHQHSDASVGPYTLDVAIYYHT